MQYDLIVIGGGIVGLATAYQALRACPDVKLLLVEKEPTVAAHQTGHNSGVIHSGIYYKPGSLKAENCLRGYRLLLEFCDSESIPYEICGKVIVATRKEELPALERIEERGRANGLEGVRRIGPEEIKAHEPHVSGLEALFVPQTGIVDYKAVCERLAERVREMGGQIELGQAVEDIQIGRAGAVVCARPTGMSVKPFRYEGKIAVNCAGLYSDKVALMDSRQVNTRIIPFRGEYFELKEDRQRLVKNLIYPVPDPNFPFLGVHFTRMIQGGVEAGPNAVFAFKREGYTNRDVNLRELYESLAWPGFRKVAYKYWKTGLGELYRSYSKAAFARALQRLVPEVRAEDLLPAPAGVRAQACDRSGGLLDDFAIVETEKAVHVLNAPSPAATSALSIGMSVAERAVKRLDFRLPAWLAGGRNPEGAEN